MRGLCHHSAFDRDYHFRLDEDGEVELVGFKRSAISYNSSRGEWQLQSWQAASAVRHSKHRIKLDCSALESTGWIQRGPPERVGGGAGGVADTG